jgi:hypothetical protein
MVITGLMRPVRDLTEAHQGAGPRRSHPARPGAGQDEVGELQRRSTDGGEPSAGRQLRREMTADIATSSTNRWRCSGERRGACRRRLPCHAANRARHRSAHRHRLVEDLRTLALAEGGSSVSTGCPATCAGGPARRRRLFPTGRRGRRYAELNGDEARAEWIDADRTGSGKSAQQRHPPYRPWSGRPGACRPPAERRLGPHRCG